MELPWLRWWDERGNLLLTGWETTEQESQRAERAELQLQEESQRAERAELQVEQERQRAERLAAQLRAMGIEPEG